MTSEPDKRPRLLIHGAGGRMGQALLGLCAADDARCRAVAAVTRGKPGQRVIDGVPHFGANELSAVPDFDIAVDFSTPDALAGVTGLCVQRGAGLVSGTTDLDDAQIVALDAAAERIALLWAANFSLGVAVLTELVERAAGVLPGWDCDIVEQHHMHKRDAPSGTALALGAAAQASGAQPRYASIRAGDIVGEHSVQFTTVGERIELQHRATSRDIFARGALHAAERLHGREPGRYRLRDLL